MTDSHIPEKGTKQNQFPGFDPPTANFVYCPNQFFDVCLPHNSRGVVRLVAYLLRRILGWLDKNGNPIEQDVCVSYSELISEAGISRGAIRESLDRAVSAGFIICMNSGRKSAAGHTARCGQYRLRWGSDQKYSKSPELFDGFFAGEGCRTPIPNTTADTETECGTTSRRLPATAPVVNC